MLKLVRISVYLYGEKRRARVELDFLEILRFPLMLDRYEKNC